MSIPRPKVLSTTPLFVVSDLRRSMDFYCQKLGFQEPNSWGDPPCFAMMHRDGFNLMLSLAEAPGQVRPHGPDRVWDLFIKVADLEQELSALRSVDLEIVRGPTLTEYQMREIEVLDPDGYRICLAQDFA